MKRVQYGEKERRKSKWEKEYEERLKEKESKERRKKEFVKRKRTRRGRYQEYLPRQVIINRQAPKQKAFEKLREICNLYYNGNISKTAAYQMAKQQLRQWLSEAEICQAIARITASTGRKPLKLGIWNP